MTDVHNDDAAKIILSLSGAVTHHLSGIRG
jgi:hypothetical protein